MAPAPIAPERDTPGPDVPVTIRLARPEDAPRLASLIDELRAALGDPQGAMTIDVIRRDAFGPMPEFNVLLAERAGVTVGYALFYDVYEPAYAAKGVYLADLCVTPAARRTGVGRALMTAVATAAASRGRTYVWWLSQPSNVAAAAFYAVIAADIQSTTISRVKLVPTSPAP